MKLIQLTYIIKYYYSVTDIIIYRTMVMTTVYGSATAIIADCQRI
jgi:hypothetical protein